MMNYRLFRFTYKPLSMTIMNVMLGHQYGALNIPPDGFTHIFSVQWKLTLSTRRSGNLDAFLE
jgi:hypothetical protein